MSSNLVGTAWINRQAKAAEEGNEAALEYLTNAYNREVKRANQRARNLDQKGMNTGALIQYRKNLDGNFLSQSKNLPIKDMVKGIKKAETFMKSQTSTVSGEMSRRNKAMDALMKPKRDKRGRIVRQPIIKPIEGMSKAQQEAAMNRFFTNKHFEELKKNFGSNIIKQANEAIGHGVPIGRLSRLYNEYARSSNADLDMVWNAFTEGRKHI